MKFWRNEGLQFLSETFFLARSQNCENRLLIPTWHVSLYVRPSAKKWTPTGWVFMKLDIRVVF